jgi:dipeptidyl aminopeptidase/acylaminoacyl peptidase
MAAQMSIYKTECRPAAICLVLMVSCMSIPASASECGSHLYPQLQDRPFHVSDAVSMVQAPDVTEAKPLAHYSPDNTKLAVVLRCGNLEANTNDFSLLLWNARNLFSNPKYQVLLKMSSSSNRPAIEDITWLNDNTIAFLGEGPGELHQIYELNVSARKLVKVTESATNVRAYSFSADCRTVVFVAEEPNRLLFNTKETRQGYFVSAGDELDELIRQQKASDDVQFVDKLYRQNISPIGPARVLKLLQGRASLEWTPLVSPDGNYAVVKELVTTPADSWTAYADSTLQKYLPYRSFNPGVSWLESYELINTKTGQSRLLLNSPVLPDHDSEAVWLPDSRSLIVSNMFLPLEGVDDAEIQLRKASALTVEVGISDGKLAKVTREDLRLLSWDRATGCLAVDNHTVFRYGSLDSARKVNGAPRCFQRSSEGWQENPALARDLSPAEILWKEDLNVPPKLYAVEPSKARRVLLLDPNPQFEHLTFGRVEEVNWKASDGTEIRGGIVYPVGYRPGQRYPLVIQTHGWLPNKFMVDGQFTTAFAAQALANRGILVLQADERVNDFGTAGEGDAEQANYQGAIDYLDGRGMIDREQVGLIGFSRTCYHVKYMLTHSKYPIAAASVTDGIDFGYFQYMISQDSGLQDYFDAVEGGRPFGNGLRSWLEKAPDFRLDRVHTPLLITALYPASVLSEWEWYAGLSRLGRPVDFLVLQDGSHVLEKPWDRVTSQQTNVDWFCFWLKGEEDPDPAKAEQYARWRELRKLQEQDQRTTPKN